MTIRWDPELVARLSNAEEGETFRVRLVTAEDPANPTVQEISCSSAIDGVTSWAQTVIDCPGCTGDPGDHPHTGPIIVTDEPARLIDFSDLRETLDRTPSGEHTCDDTDDVVARINAALEADDWESHSDSAATWAADGSHEHDPPFRTARNLGTQQGPALEWNYDDGAEARGHLDHSQLAITWTFREDRQECAYGDEFRRSMTTGGRRSGRTATLNRMLASIGLEVYYDETGRPRTRRIER